MMAERQVTALLMRFLIMERKAFTDTLTTKVRAVDDSNSNSHQKL